MVTVHKPSIGLLRRGLQLGVVSLKSKDGDDMKLVCPQILYVTLYQLWYAQVT